MLIQIVNITPAQLAVNNRNELVAWLEKQDDKDEEILLLKDRIESLKSARIAVQETQKPTEWSEDDHSNFNELSGFILETYRAEDASRLLIWFKSLKDRVQPQQEWSDEDEEMIDSIIGNIKYLYSIGSCDNATVDKKVNWLKSLSSQNTWKPSEQQIKALNEVINFAADHGTMRWNDYIYNVLKGLREQLKKL